MVYEESQLSDTTLIFSLPAFSLFLLSLPLCLSLHQSLYLCSISYHNSFYLHTPLLKNKNSLYLSSVFLSSLLLFIRALSLLCCFESLSCCKSKPMYHNIADLCFKMNLQFLYFKWHIIFGSRHYAVCIVCSICKFSACMEDPDELQPLLEFSVGNLGTLHCILNCMEFSIPQCNGLHLIHL